MQNITIIFLVVYCKVALGNKVAPGVWRIPGPNFNANALANMATKIKLGIKAARAKVPVKERELRPIIFERDKLQPKHDAILQEYKEVVADEERRNAQVDDLKKSKDALEAKLTAENDKRQAQLNQILASMEKQNAAIGQAASTKQRLSNEVQMMEIKVQENSAQMLELTELGNQYKELEEAIHTQAESNRHQFDQITQLNADIGSHHNVGLQLEEIGKEIQAVQQQNEMFKNSIAKVTKEKEDIQNALRRVQDGEDIQTALRRVRAGDTPSDKAAS